MTSLRSNYATAESANEALGELGLERAGVLLSEGFCPLCRVRGVDHDVVDADPDNDSDRVATSVVHCSQCATRWRSGPNPDNGLDWIEHARSWQKGILLTMTINPPPEPPEEDWEEDWS